MSEICDIYTDSFQINTGPYGSTLNFLISPSTPTAPGKVAQSECLATIRMSLEHLKLMTFVLRNQVLNHEKQSGINIQLPIQVLNQLSISPEDWNHFWKDA